MIPTAEEFLKGKPFSIESIHKYMIEFAKLHCIEQAKVISENVEADFEPMGWLAEQHLSTPFIAGKDYEVPVSRHSILNAYSLDLIK
jgi:hypothetical protein